MDVRKLAVVLFLVAAGIGIQLFILSEVVTKPLHAAIHAASRATSVQRKERPTAVEEIEVVAGRPRHEPRGSEAPAAARLASRGGDGRDEQTAARP